MLPDGAHLNMDAKQSLGVILGGEEHPSKDELGSDESFAEWIRSAPMDFGGDLSYSEASRRIANLYLQVLEDGRSSKQVSGCAREWDIWRVAKKRWPELTSGASGASGFMHGWAFNAARHVLSMPPVQNPALFELQI